MGWLAHISNDQPMRVAHVPAVGDMGFSGSPDTSVLSHPNTRGWGARSG